MQQKWAREDREFKLTRDPRPCPNQGLGQLDPRNLGLEQRGGGGGEQLVGILEAEDKKPKPHANQSWKGASKTEWRKERGDHGTDAQRDTEPPQDRG